MSGPVRDESKQRAWLDASELAQKIFRGHYSRAVSMVLTSELFEHAYAAGHDAVEADLAAMMARRDTAIEQRDYNAEVITQRNAMLSRSAAELADMTAERDAALVRAEAAEIAITDHNNCLQADCDARAETPLCAAYLRRSMVCPNCPREYYVDRSHP